MRSSRPADPSLGRMIVGWLESNVNNNNWSLALNSGACCWPLTTGLAQESRQRGKI